jgi:hypothetical protein
VGTKKITVPSAGREGGEIRGVPFFFVFAVSGAGNRRNADCSPIFFGSPRNACFKPFVSGSLLEMLLRARVKNRTMCSGKFNHGPAMCNDGVGACTGEEPPPRNPAVSLVCVYQVGVAPTCPGFHHTERIFSP